MELDKSIIQIIQQRNSCRSFDGKGMDSIPTKSLCNYIKEINDETKIKARFLLINKNENKNESAVKLGTYGMISGASSFIIGVIAKNEKNSVEFGYLFEKIVLFATGLGLQTCWLGGTFNRNDFDPKCNLLENEFIPIVSPVGIKKENPRILDITIRALISANKRKPWSQLFFEDNISSPLKEDSLGAYSKPLEMVRLAPSGSNKQPWRIIKDKSGFNFYLCRTKGYGVTRYDIQKNDMGIAMCHFELTAKELGLNGEWKEVPQSNTISEWEYISTWTFN